MSNINWKSIRCIKWEEDNTLERAKQYKKTGKLPSDWSYMKSYRFRRLYDVFTLENNDLYLVIDNTDDLPDYFTDNNGNLLFQVNLPLKFKVLNNEKERNEIIDNYYRNILSNSYRSSKSLYERLSKEFLNISRRQVEERLKNIEVVQMTSVVNENKIVKPIVSERPFQQIEIDLIDVSSISKNNDGITFLLTCIDTFSKFAWVEPLKNKTSKSIAFTLQQILCREGSPEIISSDNGGEFVNEDFVILCKRWGITHKTSLPFHPQSQGQIERFNGTLKRTIFKYLTDYESKRYIDNLQFLVYSYNTSIHNTTKRTPFEIHKKRFQSYKILDNMVLDNLQKNALKMIENSLKQQQAQEEPLKEGDEVRVGVMFLKSGRKKIGGVNKKSLLHYTKEIYKVIEVERIAPPGGQEKDGLELFTINIDLTDETDRKFYRHQLLKVNTKDLIKTKDKNEKFDFNFNEKFDTEKHISNLSKNTAQKRLLEKEQRLIDADQREEDIDEDALLASQRQLEEEALSNANEKKEEKKLKRIRKQRDPGFFVSL
jgi:transposase InsO family protein